MNFLLGMWMTGWIAFLIAVTVKYSETLGQSAAIVFLGMAVVSLLICGWKIVGELFRARGA